MESELTAKQRQYQRGLAHAQKPLVQIGSKGLGDKVIEQIREQLQAHELVKVRFNSESAVEPADVASELAVQTKSHLVQRSGRVLLFYRRRDHKPTIELPRRVRRGSSAATAQ